MSLSESGDPSAQSGPFLQESTLPLPQPKASKPEDKLVEAVRPYMEIEKHFPTEHRYGPALVFEGKLTHPAALVYTGLHSWAGAHGYILYLQRKGSKEQILFVEGVLVARNIQSRWWVHLLLLMITIATTVMAGSQLTGYNWAAIWTAIQTGDRLTLLSIYREGRLFAFPLLFILGTHEMGHYLMARLHGVKVTLPFFVPLPVFGSLGTMGAVIFITSPFHNRKMLFDIGIAGPLAGLIVAIPIFLLGLQRTPTTGIPLEWIQTIGINRVNVPPLLDWVARLVWTERQVQHIDRSVFYNYPVALAGWFGIFLTALNLLPLGQFDGGHVAFAVLGRRFAWPIASLVALLCAVIGTISFLGLSGFGMVWLVWVGMAMLTGLHHPPPHDDITPLGWPRTILGLLVFILFFTMIVITPFYTSVG